MLSTPDRMPRRIVYTLLLSLTASAFAAPPPRCSKVPGVAASAKDADKAASRIAQALARLACEPDLFTKPARDVEKTLGLGAGELSFNGPGYVAITLAKPVMTQALLAASGAKRGYLRLHMNTYHQEWSLATEATGAFLAGGPGTIRIGVIHHMTDPKDGAVVTLDEDLEVRSIGVTMPGVVAVADPAAVTRLDAAIRTLALTPALLARDPADVAQTLRLTGDEFTMESRTANGTAKIAPVMLDRIRIGDIEVRDVEAFVAEPGKLFQTLLGMSFLRRLSQIDIRGRELVLVQ